MSNQQSNRQYRYRRITAALAALCAAAALAACNETGLDGGNADMAMPDLAPECPRCTGDGTCTNVLTTPTHCGACGVTCGAGERCAGGACVGGGDRQYAADWIFLPSEIMDKDAFGADLNGDGTIDNQFFVFLSTIKQFGIDLQSNVGNLLWSGQLVLLTEVPRADAPGKPAAVLEGVPTFPMQPDLWGGGTFTVDANHPGAVFPGTVGATTFDSVVPAGGTPPIVRLRVRSPDNKASFTILFRCHRFHVTTDSNDKHMTALVQGSIRRVDLEQGFAADVANYMTNILNAPPGTVQPGLQDQLRIFFDNGGEKGMCTGQDGMGVADDGKIVACELYENTTMRKAFEPDLQVYDQNGVFNPQKTTTKKDSLSFGVKLTGNFARF